MRLGRARETLGTDRHSGGNRLLRWQAQLSAGHTGKPSIGSEVGELCEPLKQATLGPFGRHLRNDLGSTKCHVKSGTIRLTFGRRLLPILKACCAGSRTDKWHMCRTSAYNHTCMRGTFKMALCRVIALSGCCDHPKWEVEASRCSISSRREHRRTCSY